MLFDYILSNQDSKNVKPKKQEHPKRANSWRKKSASSHLVPSHPTPSPSHHTLTSLIPSHPMPSSSHRIPSPSHPTSSHSIIFHPCLTPPCLHLKPSVLFSGFSWGRPFLPLAVAVPQVSAPRPVSALTSSPSFTASASSTT